MMKRFTPTAIMVLSVILGLSCKDSSEQGLRATAQSPTLAKETADEIPGLIRVYKKFNSGKTGKPTKTVEVLFDGTVLLKDNADTVMGRERLSAAQLQELAGLLKDKDLACEEIECGPPRSTDASFFQIGVEESHKTVIFKIYPGCTTPQRLSRLNALLDAAVPPQK